jgi:molybdenum cofactor cytidylyltransferase
MPAPAACAAVILAAGASQRLGRPKQLLLHHGEPLLRRTARFALEAGCSPVFIVLGYEAAQMAPALAGLDVCPIMNPDWQQGMSSSLRHGIEAVRASPPQPENLLLLVSDQPRLDAAILGRLLRAHSANPSGITASRYAGRLGVPAIFAAEFYAELAAISGDQGARRVLAAHPEAVAALDWPDGAFDVDTAADAASLDSVFP